MVRNENARFDVSEFCDNPQLEEFRSVHSLITANICRNNNKNKDVFGPNEASLTSTICRTIADCPSVSSTVKAIIAQFSRTACYNSRTIGSFGQVYLPSTKQKKSTKVELKPNGNTLTKVTTEQPKKLATKTNKSLPVENHQSSNENYTTPDVTEEQRRSRKECGVSRHASDPSGYSQRSNVRRFRSDNRGMSTGKTRPRMIPKSNVSQKVLMFEKCSRGNAQTPCDVCHNDKTSRKVNHEKQESIVCEESMEACTETHAMRVLPLTKTCQKECNKVTAPTTKKSSDIKVIDTDDSQLMDTLRAPSRAEKRTFSSAIKRTPSDRYQSIRKKLQRLMSPRKHTKVEATTITFEEDEEQRKLLFLQSIRIPTPCFMQGGKPEKLNARTTCYFNLLPDHCIACIGSNLDTKSLAMLKCASSDFKFVIERYNVRTTDAKWVKSKKYEDDPCKHCRRIRTVGDTTMCRFHPKFYYCGLPYGRSYWMCCHESEKDAPGCKTGLHDNDWHAK